MLNNLFFPERNQSLYNKYNEVFLSTHISHIIGSLRQNNKSEEMYLDF